MLDDIQWAEPVFLDLIEHVADWSRDAPILLLCIARPELLELRPGWGGGKLNATTILLEPLSGEDCELLISRLAGGASSPTTCGDASSQAADGNPLFIEEMLAIAERGRRHGEITVPPTIQALLQSRLDRLGPGERDVIGRGAVEGQVFHRGAVPELAPAAERDDVPATSSPLVRKELIRPDQPTYPDDEAFRFRHLLIRDAAYDSLPKETRAELHEAFADWLDRHATLVEQDEIVGYHLERAYRNRAELDSADPRLADLARRAAATTRPRPARGAEERGDIGAACGLLQRAAALLPEGDPQRLEHCFGARVAAQSRPAAATRRSRRGEELRPRPTRASKRSALIADDTQRCIRGRIVADARESEHRARPRASLRTVSGTISGSPGPAFSELVVHWMGCRAAAAAAAALRAEAHARAAGDEIARRMSLRRLVQTDRWPSARLTSSQAILAACRRCSPRPRASSPRPRRSDTSASSLRCSGEIEAAREHVEQGSRAPERPAMLVEAAAQRA